MNSQNLLLCLAILSSSFWGSWHCAGMCGPIATLAAQKKQLWSYHIARGLSYSLLGALAGYLGSFFLNNDFIYLRWISGLLMALVLLSMGFNMLKQNRPVTFFNFLWVQKIFKNTHSAALLGALSVFLPCGWLYSYVVAAVASQSAWSGALVLFLFWLGGLPALSALSLFMKKSLLLSHERKQKVSGYVLIIAGIYSLFSFYFMH